MLGTKHSRSANILVRSPARIHCALLNESGIFNRVDGGIGFALCDPYWEFEVSVNPLNIGVALLPEEHRRTLEMVVE